MISSLIWWNDKWVIKVSFLIWWNDKRVIKVTFLKSLIMMTLIYIVIIFILIDMTSTLKRASRNILGNIEIRVLISSIYIQKIIRFRPTCLVSTLLFGTRSTIILPKIILIYLYRIYLCSERRCIFLSCDVLFHLQKSEVVFV